MAFKTNGNDAIDNNRNAFLTNIAIPTTGGVHVVTSNPSPAPPSTPPMAGTVASYNSGGYDFPGSTTGFSVSRIDSFPFSSESNLSIFGNLRIHLNGGSGHSSETHGFVSGGNSEVASPGNPLGVQAYYIRNVDKFAFASPGLASSIGNLSAPRYYGGGHSSLTDGFVSGGTHLPGGEYFNPPSLSQIGVPMSSVERFPFSSSGITSYIGNLNGGFAAGAAHSSLTHAFNCYAKILSPTTTFNSIEKFSFSGVFSSSDVGDVSSIISKATGISSTTHGYIAGGVAESPSSPLPTGSTVSTLLKYPFASGGTTSSIGNLSVPTLGSSGSSSTSSGYSVGGTQGGANQSSTRIERFPFASDTSASYIADLAFGNEFGVGQQN